MTTFPINPEFGLKIKEARQGKHMSVRTLADKAGIPVSKLMRIEHGQEHIESARLLVKLSKILDVPKEELIILATKRTYDEICTRIKELENAPEPEPEECYVGLIDGFDHIIEKAFSGLSDDELFERVAAVLDMTENELWVNVAQELLHHEIYGMWSDEDDEWWEENWNDDWDDYVEEEELED